MSAPRRTVALLVALLALGAAAVAHATTGALELVHPPQVVVPYSKAAKFQGRFYLKKIGSGAQVRSAGMKIEFDSNAPQEYLIGAAQFYEYNPDGRIETGLFTIFPFRSTATGVSATILKKGVGGPGRTPPLGTLKLKKPEGGVMEGTIELHASGPYRVVFTKLAKGQAYEGKSPPARQIHEPGKAQSGGGSGAVGLASGWGAKPAEYLGEYSLAGAAPDPTAKAGVLGPLIAVTQSLGEPQAEADAAQVSGGELAVLRGEVPTAEMTLEAGGASHTFYLTELSWGGDRRLATVRSGSPTGPKVGRFVGTASNGTISGTVTAGGASYEVRFEHED
jgi:hypothetical protein